MFSVEDVLDWDIPLKGPLYEDLRPLYDYQCAVERKMRRAERLKLKKMGANNMNVYRDDSDTGSEGNDNDGHAPTGHEVAHVRQHSVLGHHI